MLIATGELGVMCGCLSMAIRYSADRDCTADRRDRGVKTARI